METCERDSRLPVSNSASIYPHGAPFYSNTREIRRINYMVVECPHTLTNTHTKSSEIEVCAVPPPHTNTHTHRECPDLQLSPKQILMCCSTNQTHVPHSLSLQTGSCAHWSGAGVRMIDSASLRSSKTNLPPPPPPPQVPDVRTPHWADHLLVQVCERICTR